ncbi:MAG: DUF4279 domain-containing protein [Acetobacteraceae bacterium]
MNSEIGVDEGAFVILDFRGDNLDPAELTSVIPLKPLRPRKKGDPLGPSRNGKAPTVKVGYCGFSTDDEVASKNASVHVDFILNVVRPHYSALREIMIRQSLIWRAVLFEGNREGRYFSDVDPRLLLIAAELGLPLVPKGEERFTVVADPVRTSPEGG